MLEIALCISVEKDRDLIRKMIQYRIQTSCAQVETVEFCTGQDFLRDFTPGKYLFLFLDTDLADLPGLEVARAVRKMGEDCPVVFLSGNPRHALSCYEVHPAGFFLKPLAYDRLCELFQWHRALFLPALRAITVISARVPRKILLMDILYIEVSGRTSLIHLKKETIATNRTLNELSAQLEEEGFLRCHRGYLVNTNHITALEENAAVLESGETVPVSEDKRSIVRRILREKQFSKSVG